MAVLPIQEAGELTFQAADPLGDTFENDGNTQLQVVGPPTGFTVSFANGRDCNFGVHHPFDLDVASGFTQAISERFSPFRFNNTGGSIEVSYSPSAVGIQVAAIRTTVLLTDPI